MVISQGDVCWASLDAPVGSAPGFRRPVAIVQGDSFNASRIATTVVVPLTSNLRLAAAPGQMWSSLPHVHLAAGDVQLVLAGIDLFLRRE